MIRPTLTTAVLLILLGLGSYFATGQSSSTALIPTGFGIILFFCGVISLSNNESRLKHAMHAAVMAALIGALGTASGVAKGIKSLMGTPLERPVAVLAQMIMFFLCTFYVYLCIKWFIGNRRARRARAA